MVKCPHCGLEQDKENLFCAQCGTKLVQDSGTPTMSFEPGTTGGVPTDRLQASRLPARQLTGAKLNLHIVRTGEIIPIGGVGEYVVGRISQGQSILPDVDLEPFHAYENGVSRLHARIRVEERAIWITDLGSANGTKVNDQKINPHKAYPLGNKDMLRLGRLNVQALVGE